MFGGFSTRNNFGATGSAFPTRTLAQLGGFDPATDFIAAANITNATQQAAIRTMVNSLVSNSLWDKFLAIYPMVGGSAYSHKFNLMNPKDANNAFRVQFFGGWTHGPSGAIGNGSNSWGATFFNPGQIYPNTTSASICIYNDGSTAGIPSYDVGLLSGAGAGGLSYSLISRYSDNTTYVAIAQSAFSTVANSTTGTGFWIGNRSGTATSVWRMVPGSTLTRVINANPTQAAYGTLGTPWGAAIGAANIQGTIGQFSNRQFKWVSFGYSLTDAEIATYETIVNTFQTNLGRNLY